MEKKRDYKKEVYLSRYILVYIIGFIILIISYIYNNEGFFLISLALIVISIFLHFLYLSTHIKKRFNKELTKEEYKKIYSYINKCRKLKIPDKKIKENLINVGWKINKIDYIFNIKLERKKERKKPLKIKLIKFKFPKINLPRIKIPSINLIKFLSKLKPRLKKKEIVSKPEIKPGESKKYKIFIKPSIKIAETDFDRLVNVVNSVGVIKISAVAKIFNISTKKVEEWSKILENHNLLKLHYPPLGEPELRKWEE